MIFVKLSFENLVNSFIASFVLVTAGSRGGDDDDDDDECFVVVKHHPNV